MKNSQTHFSTVYGPVQSWRYGLSLGIDPIGAVSTCSFNCVYCQLGEIETIKCERQQFVPTVQVQQELEAFRPWAVDAITLSGSGEPTLALNLGEILALIQSLTNKPTTVLTNGSLLYERDVQDELAIASQVAVKVDALSEDALRRINRPGDPISLARLKLGLMQFRQHYKGILAIQTMLLHPWGGGAQAEYIRFIDQLQPDLVQLNTPTRPKPLKHELDARGNHGNQERGYPTRSLKPIDRDYLKVFGDRIQSETGVEVRFPSLN